MTYLLVAVLCLLAVTLAYLCRTVPDAVPDDVDVLAQSLGRYTLFSTRLALWRMHTFGRVVRRLNADKRHGRELYAFENWLRDNDYLVERSVAKVRAARLNRLPLAGGVPRVLLVARYIVRHTDVITRERVGAIINDVQARTPLFWRELQALPDALRLAMLERLREVAAASQFSRKLRRRAYGGIDSAYFGYDVYLYYCFVVAGAKPPMGVDVPAAKRGYWRYLLHWESVAKQYFGMLAGVDDLNWEFLLTLSQALPVAELSPYISRETASAYLGRVDYLSERYNVSEVALLRAARLLADTLDCDLAEVLLDPHCIPRYVRHGRAMLTHDTRAKQRAYVILSVVLAAAMSLVPLVFGISIISILICILSFFILLPFASVVVGWFVPKRPNFDCRMGYKSVPPEGTTAVVVSRYIDSPEALREAVGHLRELSYNSPRANLHYVALIDFPSSAEEWSDNDEALLELVKRYAAEDGLSYAVRCRVHEGVRYVAWERKRGAILDWMHAAQTGDATRFRYMSYLPQGCAFAILLDDDSRLAPGCVLDAVNRMLHPANSRYDLLTFDARYRLASMVTPYSARFRNQKESSTYPTTGEFYWDTFGTALYSGKAIVRIDRYLAKLSNVFPDRRILSHDLIEGAFLTSGRLGLSVYEDAPTSFFADAKRSARWQRGDVLLAPYLARIVGTRNGRMANPIDPIYKWVLFANLLSTFRPMAALLSLFLCAIAGDVPLSVFVLGALFAPFAPSLLSAMLRLYAVRLRYVLRDVGYILWQCAERLVLLPFHAWEGCRILLSTLFSSLRGKRNLLVWQPFSCTQKAMGKGRQLRMLLPSTAFALSLGVLSGNLYFAMGIALSAVLQFFVATQFIGNRKDVLAPHRKMLLDVVARTYGYFVDNAPHGYVRDNLQLVPTPSGVEMTSPTDLGFAILAEVVAAVMGLCEDTPTRLEKVLAHVVGLPRWHGHLYNWYSIDGTPLNKVVSTVDSANFVGAVLVAESYAEGHGNQTIAALCRRLLTATFADLYDYERNMLCIVYRVDEGRMEGRYDTLASEARLAYYLLATEGVGTASYYGLARDVSPWGGNTLLSWGGTAFEYLMPTIFIRPPKGSLLYHSERNAALLQSRHRLDGLFGISESCYYAFNVQMRYRYRANGLDSLALNPDCGEPVVAPYASALTAAYLPLPSVRNLLHLRECGVYGRYGYYEAVDHGKVVQAYMAHHQGMILASLCNLLTDDVLARLFSSNPRIASALLLVGETQIEHRAPYRSTKRSAPITTCPKVFAYDYPTRAAHLLHSGACMGVYMSDGRQELYYADKLVGNVAADPCFENERILLVKRLSDGSVCSPYADEFNSSPRFEISGGAVIYRNLRTGLCEEIRLCPSGEGEVRDLVLANDGDTAEVYRVAFYQPLLICDRGGILSHRAYRDLFVTTSIHDGIEAWRQEGGGRQCGIFFSVQGLDNVRYGTNRRNFPSRNFVPTDVFAAFENVYPNEGRVLYPMLAAIGEVCVAPHDKAHVYLITTSCDDGQDAASVHREMYRTRCMSYYGMAECLSGEGRLFDKYATERVAEVVASCLMDNFDDTVCPTLDASSPKILPYLGDFTQNVTNALAVRLLSRRLDIRLAAPPEDKQGALCAAIAQSVLSGNSTFRPHAGVWSSRRFSASRRTPADKLAFVSGEGGFLSPDAYFVRPTERQTLLPYTNVVANGLVGFVLTENGGGYFFGANSREDKFTLWRNDAMMDSPTHILAATDGTCHYRLNDARYTSCVHAADYTEYQTVVGDNQICARYHLEGNKLVVTVRQRADMWIYLQFIPLLDWAHGDACYLKRGGPRAVVVNAKSGKRMTFWTARGQVYTNQTALDDLLAGKQPTDNTFAFVGALSRAREVRFAFCMGRPEGGDLHRLRCPYALLGNAPIDYLLHGSWRQLVHSRLLAKTSFYQCGGATGYRDQLQDLEAYMPYDPDYCRAALLDFSAHQYAEGDVMHWWHPPRTGVRTHVTDDRLFLVEAVTRYLNITDDKSILEQKVPFLISEPLAADAPSRYETPTVAKDKYPLKEHLLRAIQSVLHYGTDGLLLVGGGDWNDGLNDIGLGGIGQSVWLTMFAYKTIYDALPYLTEHRESLELHLAKLRHGIRRAFRRDRFLSYITDEGRVVGEAGGCALYLMTQSFAALSGAVDAEMASLALQTAKRLVDYEAGTIALFAPPFGDKEKVGYIADYPAGVRENGAQYTHAAVWYVKALIQMGEIEYAYELLCLLNPVLRCANRHDATQYKGEPYVLSADVYTARGYEGQCGWSWYTGSAGWMLRVIIEEFYGVQVLRNTLVVHPRLPKALLDTELGYLWQGKTYRIYYTEGEGGLTLDGESATCILPCDSDRHIVCHVKMPRQ